MTHRIDHMTSELRTTCDRHVKQQASFLEIESIKANCKEYFLKTRSICVRVDGIGASLHTVHTIDK